VVHSDVTAVRIVMPRHVPKTADHGRRHPIEATGDLFQESADGAPRNLAELNAALAAERPKVEGGKQVVFGEGSIGAPLAFVGEQPGDQEDLQGRPFVGPAGQILDKAFAEAGIDRSHCYITNAVKYFKFQERGKRRIHQKPTMGEVKHYRWWLLRELEFVHPHLVVALGGTAAYALAGVPVVIGRSRGAADSGEFKGYITVHPSSLLRIRDHDERETAFADFVHDLKAAKEMSARAR
jgi:uracil-DNA glycosylase family protein